ncbi:MAG TPA: NAD(P)(+) transhydrogenase (Re/Si-specific) subunit beta, partial [Polyangia bacterium]|nr:NAD(P)(+) transhydrogenase (Re/Si-specific) subunit beta [Polyangia bacterium]
MIATFRSLAYLASSLLFILSLRGLSTQETAQRGNRLGLTGMVVAVIVTALALLIPGEGGAAASPEPSVVGVLAGALGVGCVIGALLAMRVAMTSMPELVAILHSFVGAAAVLVGIATYLQPAGFDPADRGAHLGEIFVGILVGAVTFSGSVIAFGKLRGKIGSKPLLLPGRHLLNVLILTLCVALGVIFERADVAWPVPGMGFFDAGMPALLIMTFLALLLGIHLVMAIGGGDMPVVVSLLNSYSGWAAAAAGFMLSNDLLIITGALVGSSGAILSYIMCRAMNRSIWSVVLGGFGAEPAKPAGGGGAAAPAGKVNEATVDMVAELLLAARNVVIVPGYGMAVAQAQHPVKEISSLLIEKGITCRYAIHPVAGRLPGHMNVLLAEADVSYEIVKEMDEINE